MLSAEIYATPGGLSPRQGAERVQMIRERFSLNAIMLTTTFDPDRDTDSRTHQTALDIAQGIVV